MFYFRALILEDVVAVNYLKLRQLLLSFKFFACCVIRKEGEIQGKILKIMFSLKFKREEGKEGRCVRGQSNFKEMPNRKIFLSAPVKFLYIYT